MEQTSHAPEVHKKHTSPWVVFAVLAALTLIEVAISFIPGWIKNPLLLAISLSKAALVALYYMHLRYDKPIYGIIFIAPAIFGLLLAVILLGSA
jgi:cytochrome c oxidase subunit 4